MEDECSQWEKLAGEFAEKEKYYQAANQYRNSAACHLDKVLEMTRKAAEYYHMHAEASAEADDHKSAARSYFEAANQYRQVSDFATALTLFENAASEALDEGMTETAASSYLWAAFACHKLGNTDYFLTCAENMANLYDKAAESVLEEGKAERAVINLSLSAMGFATIEKVDEAKKRIEKAKRVIDKTSWPWLKTLLSFSDDLAEGRLIEAEDQWKSFKEEETIQEVMKACHSIIEDRQRRGKK
ncbi:MAG: hypothetical protein BAJATHORv1_30074 [Candidatus Thorarchaeota archaeon]|nr:MAG: hypothetical protein BAJATHORv1_30074 [Candidatus Thorarchaeota archaeon]